MTTLILMTSGKEVTVITIQTEHSSTFIHKYDISKPLKQSLTNGKKTHIKPFSDYGQTTMQVFGWVFIFNKFAYRLVIEYFRVKQIPSQTLLVS